MVGGIKRCILGCCGADGQHLFLLHQKFAEPFQPGVALATRLSLCPDRHRAISRVGYMLWTRVSLTRGGLCLRVQACLLMPACATLSN